jgi:NAD(P)H-hydrate epimerase
MIPVLGVAEMQAVDSAADVPVDVLMDRAGYAVSVVAASMGAGYGARVHVLAGKGNNGGDGYVAARYLAGRGASVVIHRFGEPAADTPTGRAARAAAAAGVRIRDLAGPQPGDLVIDAAFGTGFRGTLPDAVAAWVATRAPVLAVDIPSGVRGDDGGIDGIAFNADRTVTFHALKPGHLLGSGPDRCGEIDIVDIGLTGGAPTLRLARAEDVHLAQRERTAHKWSAGAVATIGGMPGLTGAALMAARSALVAGAGVSSLLATARTVDTYEALAPEIIVVQSSETDSWKDHASEVLSLLGRYDVLIVGPGLEPAPPRFVEQLLEGFDGPMVVDAGAITAITRLDTILERSAPTVLTPHGGEFARLTGMEPTHAEAARLATATGSVVVLKGSPTFVAGADVTVVDAGGPELASIGTGDVLAGVIAAFLARGMDTEAAAWSAAVVHGVAGARVAAATSLTAPKLVDEIGVVCASTGTTCAT